jgi:hypothetical protein
MTARNHNRTFLGRITILAALGVTSLALIAASPADAIYRSDEMTVDEPFVTERIVEQANETPVDENGKHYCSLPNAGGGEHYVKHGGTITVTIPGDPARGIGATTLTYKCNDGKWEPVSAPPPTSDYRISADEAFVDADGTLVLADPHEEFTYTGDAGFYAEP